MNDKLHKMLADAGLGSRREMERWIASGRVRVDGAIAHVGQRATWQSSIAVDGNKLHLPPIRPSFPQVIVYHKPLGEICTRHDPNNRKTVFMGLHELQAQRLILVGRLDVNTSGLLLLTSCGALAHLLMHPAQEIAREYLVRIRGVVTQQAVEQLSQGIMLTDGPARFQVVQRVNGKANNPWFRVVLCEGRQREVRRLWAALGLQVSRLKRIRFAHITLPSALQAGQWRALSKSDVEKLMSAVNYYKHSKTLLHR